MSRGDRRSLRGGTRTRAPTATGHGSASQRLCLLIQQVEFTSALARVVERDSNLRAFPLGDLPPRSIRHKNRLSCHFRPPVKENSPAKLTATVCRTQMGDDASSLSRLRFSLAVERNVARKGACLCSRHAGLMLPPTWRASVLRSEEIWLPAFSWRLSSWRAASVVRRQRKQRRRLPRRAQIHSLHS